MNIQENICPICNRFYGGEMQKHHLKPKTFHNRTNEVYDKYNLITIHKICHQKIHATFSEYELYHHYHTIERLLEHEEIQKFVKWVKKKDPDFYSKNNDTSSRKQKRKR